MGVVDRASHAEEESGERPVRILIIDELRKCAACHTFGDKDGIGPDLVGVTHVADRAWLERFIKTPDQLLADNDPIATALFAKYKQVVMPNLRLGDGDVAAVLKYIEAQGARRGTRNRKSR